MGFRTAAIRCRCGDPLACPDGEFVGQIQRPSPSRLSLLDTSTPHYTMSAATNAAVQDAARPAAAAAAQGADDRRRPPASLLQATQGWMPPPSPVHLRGGSSGGTGLATSETREAIKRKALGTPLAADIGAQNKVSKGNGTEHLAGHMFVMEGHPTDKGSMKDYKKAAREGLKSVKACASIGMLPAPSMVGHTPSEPVPAALENPVGIAIKDGKGRPAFKRSDGTTAWLPDPVASEQRLAKEEKTNEGLRGELTKFQAQMDMMFVVRMLDDWSYEGQLSYPVPALRFVQMLLHEGADISSLSWTKLSEFQKVDRERGIEGPETPPAARVRLRRGG
jgi:hypothetical protein